MLLDGADTAIGGYFRGIDLKDAAKASAMLKLCALVTTKFAVARRDVQKTDSAGRATNEDIMRARARLRNVLDPQDVGTTGAAQDNGTHGQPRPPQIPCRSDSAEPVRNVSAVQ